ncbi:hypothetical protein DUNSADRAFT_247, partial [Dunaliella salina]
GATVLEGDANEQPVSSPAVTTMATLTPSEAPLSRVGSTLGAVRESTGSGAAATTEGGHSLLQRATMPRAPPVAPTALPIFQFLFGDDAEPWMQVSCCKVAWWQVNC